MTDEPTSRPGPRFAKLGYRPCVGIMLFNRDGLVFTGRRIDTRAEAWQMPQGGIDPGELPRQAAFRELEEEIGTAQARVLSETVDWLVYDLPPELMGKVWGGDYRGQQQKWFAMLFEGRDADIDIATPKPEFESWRWTALEDLPQLIVPFKRGIYAELTRRFAHLAQKLRENML